MISSPSLGHLAWAGLCIAAVFGVLFAAVRVTMAAIGTLDGERRPLIESRVWVRSRPGAAMGWWRAHRLPLLGLLFPQRGKHLGQADGDSDEVRPDLPLPLSEPDKSPGADSSPTLEVPHNGEVTGGEWHPLDDDYDTDTLKVFGDLNAEHPVPVHEPPAGDNDPAHTGHEAPAGSAQQPGSESGEPGAQAAARQPFRRLPAADLDRLDALIEQQRQATVADPALLPMIRAALGFDSVDLYLDSMRRKLTIAGAA